MMRRVGLFLAVILVTRGIASAANESLFPPLTPSETPRAQLERSLTALAHRQLLARKDAMARVTTPDALEARRVSVRETFLRLIGGLPSTKAPLQARVTGRRTGEGFTVENVVYESLPGWPVALLDPVDAVGQPLGRAEADRVLGDVVAADRALAGGERIHIVRRARGAPFRWE